MKFNITKYNQLTGDITETFDKDFKTKTLAYNWCAMHSEEKYAYMYEEDESEEET